MLSWFYGAAPRDDDDENPQQEGNETTSEASTNTPQQQEGGGVWGFVKGILGLEQLKVEDAGDVVNKTDIDENKRKGLFSQMSRYIGQDITSMISLPVWIFEPV